MTPHRRLSGRYRTRLPAFAVLALLATPAARGEEKLVAPVYPGAQRLSPEKTKGRDRIVFASRDPHEKVQAFYLTKGTHLAKGSEGEFSGQKNTATIVVFSYEQALSILRKSKGDNTFANPAEVFLEWRGPDSGGSRDFDLFFHALERQAKKHPGHDAELAGIRKEYDWLNVAFDFKDKVEPIYKRCSNEAEGLPPVANDPEAVKKLAAEMERLGREEIGRMPVAPNATRWLRQERGVRTIR